MDGQDADRRGAPTAPALPCLFVTIQSKQNQNRSAIAKKAETLYVNIEGLIKRVGLERVGFVTLTFPDHVMDRGEASERFNSFATSFLKRRGLEYVSVPERQRSGRFHFHLVAAFPYDIRTGFDFTACRLALAAKREQNHAEFRRQSAIYFKSANQRLRSWWHDLREISPRYKFGRCETLPILSNATALARYIGAYVTTASCARRDCDKGMRTVRYALNERAANLRWSWVGGNAATARRGVQIVGTVLQLDLDGLKGRFGTKFQWQMRDMIMRLGNNFEDALVYVSKIPDWADDASRIGFLDKLNSFLRSSKENEAPRVVDTPF